MQNYVRTTRYWFKRNTTFDAISQFCHDLDQQNWETVIQIDDVNQAYNSFLDIVKTLFDKNCPVKRITLKIISMKNLGLPLDIRMLVKRRIIYIEDS